MSTKVLVFENDSGFAEELRNGLGRLGCETTVVDDANVGLQTAAQDKPDLILLAIELQRMNGFSVCNKLKRDPSLKNVPLIIMSAESTEETFEQHKRLRTRADDYVHKPIGFGTLLGHIQAFVKLEAAGDGATHSPSIADAASGLGAPSVDLSDAELMSAPLPPTRSVAPQKPHNHYSDAPISDAEILAALPSLPPEEADSIEVADADFDPGLPPDVGPVPELPPEEATMARFSMSAAELRGFVETPEPRETPEGAGPEEETLPYGNRLGLVPSQISGDSSPPPSFNRHSERPAIPSVGAPRSISVPSRGDSENPRLRQELERQRERIAELEDEARANEARIAELEDSQRRDGSRDQQVQKLQRELDDAKAKLASGRTPGAARETLDLREQLNRKDKEMLDLRDQLTHRDKDLLALRDSSLSLEREKTDLLDRQSELEKQVSDLSKTSDALKNDKDAAAKRADDFKRKADRLKADLDARNADLHELRAQAEARLQEAIQATEFAERERGEQALAALREQLGAELRATLSEAERQAGERERESIARREAELAEAHEARLGELRQSQEQALARRDAENAERIVETQRAHAVEIAESSRLSAERLSELETRAAESLAEAERAASTRLAARESELEREIGVRSEERDRARAEAESRGNELERTQGELAQRGEELSQARAETEGKSRELADLRRDYEQLESKLKAVEAALISTSTDLEQHRSNLLAERDRLERFRAKWQGDRVSLERTKDALAAALSQIDEIEARVLE
jgi:CheY-like chemotaxis protein